MINNSDKKTLLVITFLFTFLSSIISVTAVPNELIQEIIEKKDISLCDTSLECIEKVSYELKDVELCSQFSNDFYEKNCIFNMALAIGDSNNCNLLGGPQEDKCYQEIATRYLNRDICNKIWDISIKRDCLGFFADRETIEDCDKQRIKSGNCLCADDEVFYGGDCHKLKCEYDEYPSEHKCKKLDCKEGEVIFQNTCVTSQCTDSDGGINLNEVGTCQDYRRGKLNEIGDWCHSLNGIREYYCEGNECKNELYNCNDYCKEEGFSFGKCGDDEYDKFAKCDCFSNELKLCEYEYFESDKVACYSNSSILKNYATIGIYSVLFLFLSGTFLFLRKSKNKSKIKKSVMASISIWGILIGIVFYFLFFNEFIEWPSRLHLKILIFSSLIIFGIGSSIFGYYSRLKKKAQDKIITYIFNSVIFSLIALSLLGVSLMIVGSLPFLLVGVEVFYQVVSLGLLSILGGAIIGILFGIVLASLSSLIVEFSLNKGFIQNIKKLNWKFIFLSLIIPAVLIIIGSLIFPIHKFWTYEPPQMGIGVVEIVGAAIVYPFAGHIWLWIAIISLSLFVSFMIPHIFSKKNPNTQAIVSSTFVIMAILLLILIPYTPKIIEDIKGDVDVWKAEREEEIRIQSLKPICGNGICEEGELILTCEKDCKLSEIHNYKICRDGGWSGVKEVSIFGTSKILKPSPMLDKDLKVEPGCGRTIGSSQCFYCYELNDVREPIFEIEISEGAHNIFVCDLVDLYFIDNVEQECNENLGKYIGSNAYYPL